MSRQKERAENAKSFKVWISKLKESSCGSLVQLLCITLNSPGQIQDEMGHLWVSPGWVSFHCSHSAALEAPGSCYFQTCPWIHCLLWYREVESEKSLWAPIHFKLVKPVKGKWVGASLSLTSPLWLGSLTENKYYWLTNIQSMQQTRAQAESTGHCMERTQ